MASIQKRGNYWRVQIRKTGYPTLSATFDTKTEANLWAAKEEKRLAEQSPAQVVRQIRDQEYCLSTALDRYAEEIIPSKKLSTQKRDRGILKVLKADLGDVALVNIDGQLLSGMIRQWQGDGLGANSIRLYLAILSHLYNIARKEWGMLELINPVELVRKPKLPQGRDRRLVGDEETRLLAVCTAMNPELADIVILAIETAMRQGEILKLEWRHVNWLEHTCTSYDTKNGETRVVPLSVRAEEALQRQQQRATGKEGKAWKYTNDGMRASYNKALKRAGIEGLTFHDLRHEATSRFCEKGLPMMTVQAITGHKSTQMLKRYTHISGKALVDAVRGAG